MKEYSKPGEREVILERKQAILIFVLGVIALIAVFALGALFGKNFADRKMARAQAEEAKEAISPKASKPILGAPVKELSSATAVSSAKDSGAESAKIMEKIKEQQPPLPTEAPAKAKEEKPLATSEKKAMEEKPSAVSKPPSPETKPAGNFTIQVASFPDQASAEELIKKLAGNKWEVYSVPTEIPGKGTYYRVYVGRYESKAQAEKALVIFKSREPDHQDAFIKRLE